MPNTFLNESAITFETLFHLKNNLKIANNIARDWDNRFGVKGAKIGDTIRIRKPQRYVGRDDLTYSAEDLTDTQVSLQLSLAAGVDFTFTSKELTLDLDDFSNRYLKPAGIKLANKIDRKAATYMYQNTANAVGVPGTLPDEFKTYLQAQQKLFEAGCEQDGNLTMVINAAMKVEIIDALKGLFQDSSQIAKQYRAGMMGKAAGFTWYEDENVVRHTVGPQGGTPLVTTTSIAGATTLVTKGWTAAAASRLLVGDVFTVADVYAVNPQHYGSTGQLQQFVVTANFSSDGSGNGTISFAPAVYLTGQLQNVNRFPTADDAITVLGSAGAVSPQGLAFHKYSFGMASVELEKPGGVDMAYVATDPDTGISLRFVRQFVATGEGYYVNRFDVVYGLTALYRELCCRVCG